MNLIIKKIHNLLGRLTGSQLFIPRETWDEQFSTGAWDWLYNEKEKVRYVELSKMIQEINPASILDIGCGQGVLFHHIQDFYKGKYCGVDTSEAAISSAKEHWAENQCIQWIHSNAEDFKNYAKYDLIIFNESIYYIKNPLFIIQKTIEQNSQIKFIISMYQTLRTKKIRSKLFDLFKNSSEVIVKNNEGLKWWLIKLIF